MGSWISTPDQNLSDPSRQSTSDPLRPPSSPPHPSRSNLNPQAGTTTGFGIPYFLPVSRPELQHSHLPPGLGDVQEVTDHLSHFLPPELVCRIMDEARYWAGCRNLLTKNLEVKAADFSPRRGGWSNGQENLVDRDEVKEGEGEVWYLLSEPLGCDRESGESARLSSTAVKAPGPKIEAFMHQEDVKEVEEEKSGSQQEEEESGCWAREIIIETLSKDQGWSTAVSHHPELYGTYNQTFSWFEVSLLRDGKEVEGTRRSIQNNVHAGQYFKAHRIVLKQNDELVKTARMGDRVILWARAQYPGWRNVVREAAITVYCAPFPQQI